MSGKKIEIMFGDYGTTITSDDIEHVLSQWENEHPGKIAHRDLASDEFADLMMKKIKAGMRPARTILHN